MAFSLSGNTITQTGTDERTAGQTTILETIRSVGLLQKQGDTYILPEGGRIIVTGILKDSTGTFDLILENNTKFVCDNGGTIEIGRRTVSGGNVRYSGGGNITVSPTSVQGIYEAYLHYKIGDGDGISSTGTFNLYGSSLKLYALTGVERQDIYVSEVAGCKIDGARRTNADTGDIVFRVQQGGRIDDNNFFNISVLEFHATSTNPFISFKNNSYTDLTLGFISYSTQSIIDVDGVDVIGNSTRKGWTNNGGINFIDLLSNGNSESELSIKGSNYVIENISNNYGFHFSKTHNENIIVTDGSAVGDIKVRFKDGLGTEYTPTISNGNYSQVIRLLKTNQVVSTVGQVGTWNDYYPINKSVYGYLYNLKNEVFSSYDNFSTIKNGNLYIDKDALITNENKEEVGNYTTIDNAQELYDYAKHYLIDNYDGEAEPILTREGDTVELGSLNFEILPTNPPTPKPVFQILENGTKICILSDNFTGNLKTTGTVTGSVTGSVSDSTGIEFVVNGLPTGAVIGAWKKTGETQADNIRTSSTNKIKLEADTEYYVIADAQGYNRSADVLINTGRELSTTIELDRIVDSFNNPIIPTTLTTAEQQVASLLDYNADENVAELRLWSNASADERWNADSETFSLKQSDFKVFAYAIEQLQSSEVFLKHRHTIRVLVNELVISAQSTLRLRQVNTNAGAVAVSVDSDVMPVINLKAFTIRRDGDEDKLNTFLDYSRGVITVENQPPVVATVQNDDPRINTMSDNVAEIKTKVEGIETDTDNIDGMNTKLNEVAIDTKITRRNTEPSQS